MFFIWTFTCEPIGLSSLGLLIRILVCREKDTQMSERLATVSETLIAGHCFFNCVKQVEVRQVDTSLSTTMIETRHYFMSV